MTTHTTAAETELRVEHLAVTFATEEGDVHAIKDVSFDVKRGEILAIVGESGSGKSVATRAALRLLPRNATVTGSIRFAGIDKEVAALSPAEVRGIRGERASMVFQEPSAALNPVYRVGAQIAEGLRLHRKMSRREAWAHAVELLELVGIPEPEQRARAYPHQLSGGQKQRCVIAMALALRPRLIIADEPTTALDVTVQSEILELLRSLRDRLGTAIVLITHNMGVVADMADRVIVMRQGEVVEEASAHDLFARPAHPYTRKLLDAVPRVDAPAPAAPAADAAPVRAAAVPSPAEPVLAIDDLRVEYRGARRGQTVKAVQGVSLQIARGEILGLVGESGSGKSTIAGSVVGIVAPTGGSIRIGEHVVDAHNATKATRRALSRDIGMVFQDPRAALNPSMTIGECIVEPMQMHGIGDRSAQRARARELLEAVALPGAFAARYPHELSGGQRQRVNLARALVLSPKLIVADEPTSALDVSVQERVLELLRELQRELDFACLFITHDLGVVNLLAQRVAVMRRGEVVEQGDTARVLRTPQHAYTRQLLASVPVPDPARQRERRELLRQG